MTATYEPFTPAGSPEPRRDRYASRQDERYASQEERYPREEERYDTRYDDRYARAEDPWAAQPAPQQRSWEQPAAPAWQDPEPAPRWSDQPSQQFAAQSYSAPAYTAPAYSAPAYEASAPPAVRANRPGRAKPIILGLVVVLLAVIGWQAYRIESVIKSSNDLASAVTNEKDRSADLEKQLTNVFDPESISSATLPSVFRVRAGDFTGTAFSVGTKAAGGTANLFTNFHVVESIWKAGNKAVTLERGTTKINATIVKVDEGKDLALLVAKKTIKPLAVFTGTVKPGQQVVVVGAPLGLDDTVTVGAISAYREDDADGPTIQFDAPINPGNSGGPVVNASKQVVGLATAKARDAEGIGLAITITTACDTFKVC
ncbi:trypsin-like peptidase domain-containing protein [Actinoplanes sp. HUAS TT8]|uniref:S1C family serine protease n=1 Tax=Actinoplanes sp. HUAS TT8 TaxID=3447453 RepID=UPI003F524BCB